MNKILEIVNTLKDLGKNLKIDKEKCIATYNYKGEEIQCNVSIPSNDLTFISGSITFNSQTFSFFSEYITTYYDDCRIDYYSQYKFIRFFPKVAEIELPYGYGLDCNYFFTIEENLDVEFSGYEYEDLNFEPFRKNLNDWDDEYVFYLKLQGVL